MERTGNVINAVRLVAFALLTSSAAIAHGQAVCDASTVAQLKACASNIGAVSTIRFDNDISCSGGDCCGPGASRALIDITGTSGKTIDGGGHTLTRNDNQRTCPAVHISTSSNITLSALGIEEGTAQPPCDPTDNCAATVDIEGAQNVTLDRLAIDNGKAYVVRAWGVDGFTVTGSSITNAGIIGLYVGHYLYAPSRRVNIQNSTIYGTRTNAIAIEGISGDANNPSTISGNDIYGNHWHGLWPTPLGTMNPGGQLDVVVANNLTIQNNRIGNGHCDNCNTDSIGGIELGNGLSTPSDPLNPVAITNNFFYNNSGSAVYANQGTPVGSGLSIANNIAVNNVSNIDVPGSQQAANTLKSALFKVDWESASAWPADWSSWQTCPGAPTAQRWCPGSGQTANGQCVARMTSAQCGAANQLWMQGSYNVIGPGQRVYASAWVRNGGATGSACLVFVSTTYVELGTACKPIQPSGTWSYKGTESLEAYTPAGTGYVALRFGLLSDNSSMDVDDIRITW